EGRQPLLARVTVTPQAPLVAYTGGDRVELPQQRIIERVACRHPLIKTGRAPAEQGGEHMPVGQDVAPCQQRQEAQVAAPRHHFEPADPGRGGPPQSIDPLRQRLPEPSQPPTGWGGSLACPGRRWRADMRQQFVGNQRADRDAMRLGQAIEVTAQTFHLGRANADGLQAVETAARWRGLERRGPYL